MTESDIQAMHGKPVRVVTHSGAPVSTGNVRVTQDAKGLKGLRVEIVFETAAMSCAMGVPLARLRPLLASFDGAAYHHRLPEGDEAWIGNGERPAGPKPSPPAPPPAPPPGHVEIYPLPPKSRLIGPS